VIAAGSAHKAAYDAIAGARAPIFAIDALTALEAGYGRDEGDEFITPTVIDGYQGMRDGDGIVMMNFRADRARQLLNCFCDPASTGCTTQPVTFVGMAGMTSYSKSLDDHMVTLYPPLELHDTLGEIVARAGKRQLRLAETEKYPHVTFFFNGGEEALQPGEDREMVASPSVATYDLQPEMSARDVLQTALTSLHAKAHDLLIINFANPDMVGHTGDLDAAIRAVETVDHCVGQLVAALGDAGWANAANRRSWQLRINVGWRGRITAYRPYHQSCAIDFGQWSCQHNNCQWPTCRSCAKLACHDGHCQACINDRKLSFIT
jgi:2,3-bisphosphoglycerate-independent phosphoglycerate mutase